MLKKLQLKSWLLMLCMLVGVGNAWGADKWVKTAAADLQTGDIIAIVDETSSTALSNNNGTNSAPSATAVTISDEEIAEVAGSLQWEVTITDGSYQFKVPETSNYLYCTNTNNGVRVGTNSNNAFTITTGGDDNADFLVNTATSRYIGVYNNQDWRCYTSINNNIKGCVTAFYKFVADQSDTREVVNLSFSSTTVLAKLGETFTAPTLTIDPTDALNDVIYTSDNPEAATVGDDGSVTIVGVGTAKITASIDENSTNYKGESKSYIIGVIANAGTESSPYTVADAHAAIDANDGITNIYATGIVSEIVTAYNATYGNITYNISVDGTTTADQLQAYRGKSYNGDNFTSESDIQVGDEVVIYGNLKKHNSTYEFDADNQLVSLYRPVAAVEDPVFSPAGGTFSEAQNITITCATEDATIYYTLDGTEPTASSTEYTAPIQVSETTTIKAIAVKGSDASAIAEATYTIEAPITIAEARVQATGSVFTKGVVTSVYGKNAYIQDETAAILVYGSSNITDLTVGDEITVSGELTTYNGLLEIKNPVYVVVSQGNTVNPTEMTIEEINAADAPQSWLVRIVEATVSAIDSQNVTLAQGENTVAVRFNATSDITFSVNDIVSLTGNIGCYNTVQIANPTNVVVQENTDPVINASDVSITYDATSGEIAYTIDNTVAGVALEATTTADWISDIVVDAAAITFTTTANEGTEDRTATITLTYGEVTEEVTVTQGHLAVDFAILPFSWSGGASADFNVLDGVTTNGLGSDYAASNAPYLIKLDGDGDYIMVKTDSRPGVVTIGVKMLGGANTSTITVQGSSDGETFTDVDTLTISGTQNATLTLVTTKDFAENDRYVKLAFTKGSNVGVGPITIEKYTIKQDATIAFKKDGEVITALTANLNDMVEVAVECSVEGATLTYTSSNANVATYEDGVVLALAEGEATITATFAGNDEYKAATTTLAVTVVDNRQEVTLAFSDVPAEINLNETATYAVTATPAVEGLSVTYSSSAPTVVSVDEATGEITALATGSATITATFAGNDEYKAAEASYTIAVVDPSFVASKYELVTDATTLKADDEIIIVDYEASGATYAISTNQKSSNREATSVTVADDGTITPSADVAIITLGGETNAWTFYVTNGAAQGYLYASSSSQNQLKTEAEVDENGNANAKIEIANGAATVTFQGNYTRNIMQYNYNNGSPLFACYNAIADTRSLVSIYRKVASDETLKGDVNRDGKQSIADVTALVNIILGKVTEENNPDDYDFKAADVNNDGSRSIADVTALVNIILGKTE